jgi:uncharacterized membrane protein YgcG
LLIFAAVASVVLVGSLPASATEQTRPRELQVAACNAVKIDGRGFVLYRHGVTCSFAKTWAKRLASSQGRRKPRGYACSSGSKFRGGGYCERGNRHFGWHSGE